MPKKPPSKQKLTLEGSKNFLVRQAEMLANELRMDPFEIISRFAIGDVVGLGMMTQAELDEPGRFNRATRKWTILPGKTRAWQLIGADKRFDAAKELLPYLYAKKQAITITDGSKDKSDPTSTKRRVIVHLPSNGRESTT